MSVAHSRATIACRKRRIKCGEEKPICGNCVKSKRVCEGYAQRVVFKNPLGLFGVYGPPQIVHDPQTQSHMQMPQQIDYRGPLPLQQTAAAAQHPMLAPRLTDPVSMGHRSSSAGASQSTNIPQYQYPQPPAQNASYVWTGQNYAQVSHIAPPNNIEDEEARNDDLHQQVRQWLIKLRQWSWG